jgi:hypothetical protein
MSNDERRQLRIDKYINEEMSLDEKNAFEKAVQEDKELAESLALSQDMQAFFKNETLELEQKLDTLGQKYFLDKKNNGFFNIKWLAGLSLVLMIALAAAIYIGNSTTPTPNILEEKSIIKKDERSNPEPSIDKEIIEEKSIEIIPNKNIPNKPQVPIAEVDLSLYAVNPMLENILKEQMRASDETTITKIPPVSIKHGIKTPFGIKGETTLKPPYELLIYSNKKVDFDNNYTILKQKISAKKNKDSYDISFNANLSLEKGLYYFIIQKETTSELMYINKFSVE